MSLPFQYHCWRRDLSNFSLLRHRRYDGFLISMHQSGTHWLKHILGCGIAARYGLPEPEDMRANRIIGGPKDARTYHQIPYLVSAHSVPHALLGLRFFRRAIKLPPYVLLVRDIRGSLVSNFEKWKKTYDCDFSTYLRGDMAGGRFNNDIWWCIRFCNAWGRIAGDDAQGFSTHLVRVMKYEALQRDTLHNIKQINEFWSLGLSEAHMERAIHLSSKEKMAKKKDHGHVEGITVIRQEGRRPEEWFNGEDRQFFTNTLKKYLRFDFGYDYTF